VVGLVVGSIEAGAADAAVSVERVRPTKVLYELNERAAATVTLRNRGTTVRAGVLRVVEERDVAESREICSKPVTLQPKETRTLTIKWDVGAARFGRGLRATFVQDGAAVDSAVEFYQVADPRTWFRCFMINAGGDHEHKAAKKDPFLTYGNFDNHFAYMLSGFSHLAPEQDEWVGGQFNIRFKKKDMLEKIRARQALGVRAGAYTIGAVGGPAGYEWARERPESILRDEKGAFLLAWGTSVSPVEVARKTTEPLSGWYSLIPDFGDPEVVRYGGEEIVRAIRMFGWDAVFFDGIYGIRPRMGGAAHLWDGQAAGRGQGDAGLGRLAVTCVRQTIDIIRAAYPNVALWYNGSLPRPGNPLNDAYVESLKDANCGTLLEIQGAQIANPNFYAHQWRNLYEAYLTQRDALLRRPELKRPARAAGYLYNMNTQSIMTKEEYGASRDTWTTANHIGMLMLATTTHPCVLNSIGFRPACQFMTRYSALLWAADVELVKEPWDRIQVESNREVWWEECVYRRRGPGFVDTLIHVVNSPDKEEIDFRTARDPEPARFVEVECEVARQPEDARVWALQPYGWTSREKAPFVRALKPEIDGRKLIVELPPFSYYTLVVIREKE